MAAQPEITNMALFCDFENVALGVRDAKYAQFDIKKVLERLLLKGSIVVTSAASRLCRSGLSAHRRVSRPKPYDRRQWARDSIDRGAAVQPSRCPPSRVWQADYAALRPPVEATPTTRPTQPKIPGAMAPRSRKIRSWHNYMRSRPPPPQPPTQPSIHRVGILIYMWDAAF